MSETGPELPRVTPLAHLMGRITIVPPAQLLYGLRRSGQHHFPRTGPVLLVSNHVSNADPPLLGVAALPRILYFMAKRELFDSRPLSLLIRTLGAFPIDRGGADRTAMRVSRAILERGDCLLMFPEGTRAPDGRLGRPHPGAGTLALVPGVQVVPVAIWGSQKMFGRTRVRFGPPIDMSDLTEGSRGARSRAAVERMMEHIARLLPLVGGPAQEAPKALAPDG
jgi:1-acyl-sn-glycerol-3-phosphate acyltransferase